MLTQTGKLRRIEAGRQLLEGKSFKQALIGGGFAEATARKPNECGLGADRCVDLALEADDEEVSLVELRKSARALFKETLALANPKKTGVVAAARAAEIAERLGQTEDRPVGARELGDRLAFMAKLIAAYKSAGGDVEALGAGLRPMSKEKARPIDVEHESRVVGQE